MTMFQEEGAATYHGSVMGRRAAEEGPLLVPCLRSGEYDFATTGETGFSVTAGGRELHHQQGIQQENTCSYDADRPRSETPPNGLENRAEGQERRRTGMVAASVRAGDWVLPNRCVDDFASRGGGDSLPGGKKGVGWLRVEAVSVG